MTTKNGTVESEGQLLFGLNENDYIWVYCGIIVFLFLFSLSKAQTLYFTLLNSSNKLHNSLFGTVIRVPMRFFEVNSFGRVLNLFVNDVGVMDETIPQLMASTVQVFCIYFSLFLVEIWIVAK